MEYTTLKKVHLFFYSLDENNNYNFILYKDSSNNKEEYTHIYIIQ